MPQNRPRVLSKTLLLCAPGQYRAIPTSMVWYLEHTMTVSLGVVVYYAKLLTLSLCRLQLSLLVGYHRTLSSDPVDDLEYQVPNAS